MVSGESLRDAVHSLGLTRYDVEEMNGLAAWTNSFCGELTSISRIPSLSVTCEERRPSHAEVNALADFIKLSFKAHSVCSFWFSRWN